MASAAGIAVGSGASGAATAGTPSEDEEDEVAEVVGAADGPVPEEHPARSIAAAATAAGTKRVCRTARMLVLSPLGHRPTGRRSPSLISDRLS
ncbi:hypothetical protein GCM10010193_31670 [Kitasatospora atroaurantiaca]